MGRVEGQTVIQSVAGHELGGCFISPKRNVSWCLFQGKSQSRESVVAFGRTSPQVD